ncbi:MAG: hypothetical protein CME62_02550 [Halobacteriovoraceae bacterium]|nr:hypothetical protein [Halobacteriovoraceae bacterium]|tara:strand:- start:1789 stop:3606 length:1818 start_codon:yes stop_codon:yes gene_type:complete
MKLAKYTVCDMLKYRVNKTPKSNAIGWIDNNSVHFYNFETYQSTIESISVAFLSFGIKKSSKIALLSNTRKEWHILDFGILCSGAITVPIYPSYKAEDILFILNHSEAEYIIVENQSQFQKLIEISDQLEHLKRVFTIENIENEFIGKLKQPLTVLSYDELINHGIQERQSHPDLFQITIEGIHPPDLATIIYTSGTTGQPKGAVITHEALFKVLENIDVFTHNAFHSGDRFLTYLPLAHVLGRCESFLTVLFGCETVYAESMANLIPNMQLVKPTLMTGVPRVFEKIYEEIQKKMNENPLKKTLLENAMLAANSYFNTIDNDRTPSSGQILAYQLSKKLVLAQIYQKFGGKIRFFISGGAPLSPEIISFLRNCSLTILEGYGLTETVAPCCINPLNKQMIGTVGQPIGDVCLKIAADGEILIQSKALFKEYYKNPKATAEVFTEDHWFKTGDIGYINDLGFLKITDRKKDIIITSGGKNVAPQKIENLLKLDPLIAQAVVIGDQRKFLTALLSVDREQLTNMQDELGIEESLELEQAINHPAVTTYMQKIIEQVNENLASFETIKNFRVLPIELSQENFLTPSLKIKRKAILNEYKSLIDAMYK